MPRPKSKIKRRSVNAYLTELEIKQLERYSVLHGGISKAEIISKLIEVGLPILWQQSIEEQQEKNNISLD